MDSTETTLIEGTSSPDGVEQPGSAANLSDDMEVVIWQEIGEDGSPIEVKIPLKEMKAGYLRQSDYTRKTQELAQQRAEIEAMKSSQTTVSDDDKAVFDLLKQQGFVTKEELARLQRQQEGEKQLDSIIAKNPELEWFKEAIRQIGKTTDMAYEDIVVKYGFSNTDKLARAKSANRDIKWVSEKEKKEVSIKDMSPAEYEAWKKTNTGSSKRR